MTDQKQPRTRTGRLSSGMYSSKIIKAGALIGDTKTLLSHWDVNATLDDNLHRIQRDNFFGKASRSRVEDILAIFRQRYLTEKSVTQALVTLVLGKFPSAALDRLLYFHRARADQLLHDAVTEILVPMQARGLVDINVQDFQRPLGKVGRAKGRRPAIGLKSQLSALLKDCSRLFVISVCFRGRTKKIAPVYFPIESFCVCRLLSEAAPTIRSEADRVARLEAIFPAREKGWSDSCLRPTSVTCWSTMLQAASPG